MLNVVLSRVKIVAKRGCCVVCVGCRLMAVAVKKCDEWVRHHDVVVRALIELVFVLLRVLVEL